MAEVHHVDANIIHEDDEKKDPDIEDVSLHAEDDIIQEERNIIRIKVQQKRGNKKVTIIEKIPIDLQEHVLSSLKKTMGCGGICLSDGVSIQLQGDKTNMGIVGLLKKHIKGCKVELNGRIS